MHELIEDGSDRRLEFCELVIERIINKMNWLFNTYFVKIMATEFFATRKSRAELYLQLLQFTADLALADILERKQ